MSEHTRYGRHLPPAKEVHSFLAYDTLKHFLGLIPFEDILREEKHTNSVISFFT